MSNASCHTGAEPELAAQRTAAPGTEPRPLVVVVGNPNVGKTTLFNRLTGQNARVGNYPGVTVERRVGKLAIGELEIDVADVPGAYSLSARSLEEQLALNAILGLSGNPRPDLVIAVVDAGQLIRNLYLVLQLAELRVPLVIALNMIDEVQQNPPNPRAVSELFGVPCVATDARRGTGLAELREHIACLLQTPQPSRVVVRYPEGLRSDVDRVAEALPREWRANVERDRALALWALTSIETDDELEVPPTLRERCLDVHAADGERDIDREVITTRYAFLDENAPRLFLRFEPHPPKRPISEKLDRVLLHPVLGFVFFLLVMFVVFQALFSWSEPAISLIESVFGGLKSVAENRLPESVLRDLLTEGVIGGVGNVLVFLPQILLLFLFIGLLEDSGYMSRVAYLMDRIMRLLGLHGRAFIPMLSGFACAVPAILATRTMERKRDRLLTMLVVPLMTCSARLPVYTLLIGALFPHKDIWGWLPLQGAMMITMYVFSLLMTLTATAVLGRTVVKGKRVPLILELPPYRLPSVIAVLRLMFERASVFLKEAGTIILACTIVLWALLSFPRAPETHAASAAGPAPSAVVAQPTAAEQRAQALEHSYAGRLGKELEPALKPLGFDWKIGVGIIGAFAAREVFVSTMGVVYGVGEKDDAAPLRERMKNEKRADGRPVYTPLTGLSLMIFFALACQCMSTLAVVRRETRSWRWPAFLLSYMTALAYIGSLLVYQVGKLLGFG